MQRINNSSVAVTIISAATFVIANAPSAASAQRGLPAEAAANAQEQEQIIRAAQQAQQDENQFGARRGTRAGTTRGRRGGAFGGLDSSFPDAATQTGVDSAATSLTDAAASKEPKELIALSLWQISIEMPKAKTGDDVVASLIQKANDLPPVLALDDVRLLLGKLSVAGVLRRSREFQLLAVNGQTARTQSGAMQPSVTNTTVVNRGRTNTFTNRNVGTIVQVTPSILANGNIQLSLSYESSETQKMSPPVVLFDPGDGSEPSTADQVVTQQINTSVQLKRGTAMVVQRDVLADPANEQASVRTQLMIIAASVLPPLN